jgi:hypothetical protein
MCDSLITILGFPDQKAAGSKDLEEYTGNMPVLIICKKHAMRNYHH